MKGWATFSTKLLSDCEDVDDVSGLREASAALDPNGHWFEELLITARRADQQQVASSLTPSFFASDVPE